MPDDPAIVDLLIAGAGPSACAAAIAAVSAGRSVRMLQAPQRGPGCGGWIGPAGVALCSQWGLTASGCGAAEFSGLRIWSWDLKKNADVKGEDLTGWIVDPIRFDAALAAAARKRGVDVIDCADIRQVQLRDQQVELTPLAGAALRGRVLLMADGPDSPVAALARVIPAGGRSAQVQVARFEAARSATSLSVAIGGGRITQLATIAQLGRDIRVTLISRTPEALARPSEAMSQFCEAAMAAGLLPRGPVQPRSATLPAGAALDLETHVGKRCLLIGSAGGFVASFSQESIYPSMRSGCLAAEVACRAVDARLPQDELATFDPAWRSQLADYLRMPNTDLSLLMPLVFGNSQMSLRVARAFLLGQQF